MIKRGADCAFFIFCHISVILSFYDFVHHNRQHQTQECIDENPFVPQYFNGRSDRSGI